MIRINLLPLKDAQRAMDRRQQFSIALLGLLLTLLVMVIPYMLQLRTSRRLDADNEELRAQITKFDEQTKEVRDLDRMRKEFEAKLKVIDDLNQKRVGPVRVLEDLSSATPEKLWLVDFTEVDAHATINGMALDNQTIAVFMRQLQTSKYFFEVDLVETSQSEPLRGVANAAGGFKKFIIKAHLDYLGGGGKVEAPPSGTPPAAGKTGT